GYGPSGARMHLEESNPTKAIDWTEYVNDTFAKGANVDALESAYGKTKAALGDTKSKAGVFFTILYPGKKATSFGTLGGKSLDFSKMEDRKYAVKWMIDEQISLFNKRGYKNLDLVGFYWLEEYIAANDDKELLNYASDYLHSKGLKFIWIPWYKANGYDNWKNYGFDVACMQPNLMWLGFNDPMRVKSSVQLSEKYGLSMEMECDGRVYTDEYFARYLNYLDGGLNSSMMDSVKMYYQDGKTAVYYRACYSTNPQYRMVYDLTYKYAKKTLTQSDIDAVRPETVENGYEVVNDIGRNNLKELGVDWLSVGKSYTACKSFVDGNGADYQQVSGKELTDGIIASKELSTDWHAFHHSLLDKDGRLSVVVDLGEVRNDLTHFYAHFDNRLDFGIGSPLGVTLYVSNDGKNFRQIAVPKLIMDSTDSCIKHETAPISARYVKMSFGLSGGSFVFCSEFLVGAKKAGYVEPSEPEESTKPEESKPESTSKPDETSKNNGGDENSNGGNEETRPEGSVSENDETLDNNAPESVSESNASENSENVENNENGVWLWVIVVAALLAVVAIVIIVIVKKRK
ncbi:MAG: DUF4855 domain-containing protein, partial [Clostridia bacterium]|nr:DUF4855 domain-containing protein [Clostridia bacterium]